jgi:hypothetical protein
MDVPGTFCHPQTLADTQKPRPVTPVLPNPPAPDVPTPGTVPDTAAHDPTHAGSLPTSLDQLSKAATDIANATNRGIARDAGAVVQTAQALVQEVSAAIGQDVAQLQAWLAPIQAYLADRIADARYGSYAATTDYTKLVEPSVVLLDLLLGRQLSLQQLQTGLTAAGTMALDIATLYYGVSPEQAASLVQFKKDHLDPLADPLGDLYNYTHGGFDLGQAPGDFLARMDQSLGDDIPFKAGCHQLLAAANQVSAGLDTLSDMLKLSTEFLQSAQTALMAACQLLAAAKAFIAHAGDILANLPFLLASLVANLLPTGNLTFKVPRPVGTLLMSVDGLRNVLAGYSDVGKCFNNVLGGSDAGGKTALDTSSSSDALQGMLTSMAASIAASLSGGLGKLLALLPDVAIPNVLDPVRAAWEGKPSLNDTKPPRLVFLPEESAILSFLSGFGAVAGFVGGMVGSLFGHGASAVSPEALYQPGVDAHGQPTGTPVVPPPGQGAQSLFTACREATCNARRTDALANALQKAGVHVYRFCIDPSEYNSKQVLSQLIGATAAVVAGHNLALDEHFQNPSEVAADYYACQAADHRAPDPANPPAPPGHDDLVATYQKIATAPAGAPNSVLAITESHSPTVPGTVPPSADSLIAGFPLAVNPPGYYEPAYTPQLVPTPATYTLLPMLLLLQNTSAYNSFQHLLALTTALDVIRLDPQLLAAHQTLLAKAIRQGVAANSPFVWLATGLGHVPAGTTVLAFLQDFLRHSRAVNILPFAAWLEAGAALDYSVPFVLDLTPQENAAAQASQAFANVYAGRALEIESTILQMRLRADVVGQALGYEYVVVGAILGLLNHLQALLLTETVTPEDVVAVGTAIKSLLKFVTHRDAIEGALKALAGA